MTIKKLLLLTLVTMLLVAASVSARPSDEWDKSSLVFTKSAGMCSEIKAQVCNHADKDMAGTSTYEVYYIASGNPKNGAIIDSGVISALGAGECETLMYDPLGVEGDYMFKAYQRPGHPGQGVLWSEEINVKECGDTQVPEFGILASVVILGVAGLFIFKRRR